MNLEIVLQGVTIFWFLIPQLGLFYFHKVLPSSKKLDEMYLNTKLVKTNELVSKPNINTSYLNILENHSSLKDAIQTSENAISKIDQLILPDK